MKKLYTSPQMTPHGDVRAITGMTNQIRVTDVPDGTPVNPGDTINDVTS